MSRAQAVATTPLSFFLGRKWTVTSVSGAGVGMGRSQSLEFVSKDGAVRLKLSAMVASGTKLDWNTFFDFRDGDLTTTFAADATVATIHQSGDDRIRCRVRRRTAEEPGEWEAQEGG
jgi:hypothetical protein